MSNSEDGHLSKRADHDFMSEDKVFMAEPEKPDKVCPCVAGVSFGAVALCLVFLLILHLAVILLRLLFDIPWNTWLWIEQLFVWGVGIASVLTVSTALLDAIADKRYRKEASEYAEYSASCRKRARSEE